MTEQQTQSQELTVEQHLEQLTNQYIRYSVEQSFSLRGGNLEKFDEFWGLISPGIELGQDHSVSLYGKPAAEYISAFKKSPDLQSKFFEPESSQSHPAPSQEKQEASPKQAEPEIMYVSRAQLANRQFMLQAGAEISKAIQSGKVKVDDARAVLSGHEIREFLAPKEFEDAAQTQPKAAPKRTTEVSKSQLLDRGFLRKVDSEWSDQGGYLQAVQKGLITVK